MTIHPVLIGQLADDRLLYCPCGAVADKRGGFCRKCQATMAWRHHRQAGRHAGRRKRGRLAYERGRVLALAAARFRLTGKEAQS